MSFRFEAEDLLREAASGAIPTPGDVLLRVQEGWIFGKVAVSDLEGEIDPDQISTLPFAKITGAAARSQLPSEIAYEDEANVFLIINTFQQQVRRGVRTISALDSPYTWQAADWHLNADTDLGPVTVLVPDAGDHSDGSFSDQLHVKNVGSHRAPVALKPFIIGQKIDGAGKAVIRESMRSFTLVSDGSNWWIQ